MNWPGLGLLISSGNGWITEAFGDVRRQRLRGWGWSVLLPGDDEVVDLADGDAGSDVGRGAGGQAGQAGEQGGQRDFAVESGEGGTEAEVGSGGEAQVRIGFAADVESVGVGEG